MSDTELFDATRRASTVVMTLRHLSRQSSPEITASGVLEEIAALELELAALTHDVQMREVERWLQKPIVGRVSKPVPLSSEVDPRAFVERVDAIGDPRPVAPRVPPALSGRWRMHNTRPRRAS